MSETTEKLECCANCKFIGDNEERRSHTCRKCAPSLATESFGVLTDTTTEWPLVNADDWCGDFEMKRG